MIETYIVVGDYIGIFYNYILYGRVLEILAQTPDGYAIASMNRDLKMTKRTISRTPA